MSKWYKCGGVSGSDQEKPTIRQFLDTKFERVKPSLKKNPPRILATVETETLFGHVDCDIHESDDLK